MTNKENFISDIDCALLIRLLSSCNENNIQINKNILSDVLLGEYVQKEIDELVIKANAELRNQNLALKAV